MDENKGAGWVVFAWIMLLIMGTMAIINGVIAAFSLIKGGLFGIWFAIFIAAVSMRSCSCSGSRSCPSGRSRSSSSTSW